MRDISGATLTEVQKVSGALPVIMIEVYWRGLAYGAFRYATQDLNVNSNDVPEVPGYISEISGLSSLSHDQFVGTSGSVTISLVDPDNFLKELIDTGDIHKAPVVVWQTFQNDITKKALLFQGEISSPISWRRNAIKFTVIARTEDSECGFSPEQGFFKYLSAEAVGKMWPMCFGKPVNVPARRLTARISGKSLTRVSKITYFDWHQASEYAHKLSKSFAAYLAYLAKPEDYDDDAALQIVGDFENDYVVYRNYMDNLARKSGLDLTTQTENLSAYWAANAELEVMQIDYDSLKSRKQTLTDDIIKIGDQREHAALMRDNWGVDTIVTNPWKQTVTYYDDVNESKTQELIETDIALADKEKEITDQATLVNDYYIKVGQDRDALLANQFTTLSIYDGYKFPQNTDINIKVSGLKLRGQMSGNTFSITEMLPTYRHVKFATVRPNDYTNELHIQDATIDLKHKYCLIATKQDGNEVGKTRHICVYVTEQRGTRCIFEPVVFVQSDVEPYFYDAIIVGDAKYTADEILEVCPIMLPTWFDQIAKIDPHLTGLSKSVQAEPWSIEIGDTVILDDPRYEDIYIFNSVSAGVTSSSTLYSVMAYRTFRGKRRLVPVPSSYYTVNYGEQFGDLRCATLHFKKPLEDYLNEKWDPDIVYVTHSSIIGQNVVDVITYLIENYTHLDYDISSFDEVAAATVGYPVNFALLDRRNSLELIRDIAWQSRCMIYIRNGVAYLKYLPDGGVGVGTLNDADIINGSLEIEYTPTEDIVTKLIGKWRPNYAEGHVQTVLRNNTGKYGTIEQDREIFIYNNEDCVLATLTFWLIRYSNTWKRIKCKTPLHKLMFEAFDTVTTSHPDITDDACNMMIESSSYNPENVEIDLVAWVPVRAGEMIPYDPAYPYLLPSGSVYPTERDQFAGGFTDGDVVNNGGNYDYSSVPLDLGLGAIADVDFPTQVNIAEYLNPTSQLPEPDHGDKVSFDEKTSLMLDLRSTRVMDYKTGQNALLSDLLSVPKPVDDEKKARLALRHDANIANETTDERGSLDLVYDETTKKHRAFNPVLGYNFPEA